MRSKRYDASMLFWGLTASIIIIAFVSYVGPRAIIWLAERLNLV